MICEFFFSFSSKTETVKPFNFLFNFRQLFMHVLMKAVTTRVEQ